MKKRSSKLESTRKTEQDRPCRKFWLLVKGQRKKSKSKSKSTGLGSKSTDTGPGRFRVRSRVEQWIRWRHHMTCRWRGLGLTWTSLRGCWRGLMTSSGDVRWHQQLISARGRSVLFTGAWRRRQKPRRRVEARAASFDVCIIMYKREPYIG